MDKGQALHTFWSSFGWTAIDEQSAYDTAVLEQLAIGDERITYEEAVGNLESGNLLLTGNLWKRTTSWTEITRKAEQIAAAIRYGGRTYKIDNGFLKIMLPMGQIYRRGPSEDDGMRHIVFNIEVMFMTKV